MENRLTILWTNADPITAEKMVFMYARASKKNGWWDDVTLLIWGATASLVVENEAIREKLAELQEHGVHISACRACADQLEATPVLEKLGVEVIYWGEPLTEVLKGKGALLSV